LGETTISSVAIGPRNSEASHHSRPLRPLDWAKPVLISDSVPQPTKNSGCAGMFGFDPGNELLMPVPEIGIRRGPANLGRWATYRWAASHRCCPATRVVVDEFDADRTQLRSVSKNRQRGMAADRARTRLVPNCRRICWPNLQKTRRRLRISGDVPRI